MNKDAIRIIGAVIYCTLVTMAFFACLAFIFIMKVDGAQEKYLLIMLGALIASFKDVGNYFTGSTMSSQSKDETISTMAGTANTAAAKTP